MPEAKPISLTLRGTTLLQPVGAFRPLLLDTNEGSLEARFYEAPGSKTAILWLGEGRSEFDSPAKGAYDQLSERYQALGASSLRLQYRQPQDPAQCALDALVAAFMLAQQGFERLAVVGHGTGALGAVQVGLAFPMAAAIALIAPIASAADGIEKLSPKPLLILHGTGDKTVATSVSRDLLSRAKEPKRIYYYQNAGHLLDEAADAVVMELSAWLTQMLELAPKQA